MAKKKQPTNKVRPGSAQDVPDGHVRLKRPRHRGTVNETWYVKVVPPSERTRVNHVFAGWQSIQSRRGRPPTPLEKMTPWHRAIALKEIEAKAQAATQGSPTPDEVQAEAQAEAQAAKAPRPKARRKSRASSTGE